MDSKRVTRKLRAILSADVQGYSRLMGDDEVATFKTITEYREVFSSIVTQYNGRVVDSPGDNILSEFASVVDAVQCAVEIQKVLKAKNDALPEDRRMIFRMGVNLGDVIHEDDRIYGDGVNIAARIESLAEPGGICISGTAYEHIENKLALGYEFFGEHSVKNIKKPVKVYRVPMEPGAKKKRKRQVKKWYWVALALLILILAGVGLWGFYSSPISTPIENRGKKATDEPTDKPTLTQPDKPSIAVLPFDNISGNPREQYLCDGFTEHIITVLAKIPDLSVTARNTSFTYKGKAVDIKELGKKLKVGYVLEGSLQKSGDRVRVTAQLIDTATGNHLWAENYDREIRDIFELQDEIALKILRSLHIQLVGGSGMKPCARATDNVEAYLKFLEAIHYMNLGNIEGFYLARKLCEESIAADPDFGPAYAFEAETYLSELDFCVSKSPKESVSKAYKLAKKALSVNNSCPYSLSTLGRVYAYMGQYKKSMEKMQAAIAMDPNWGDAYVHSTALSTDWKGAIELMEKAFRMNPLPSVWYYAYLGMAYRKAGMYQKAITAFKDGLQKSPGYFFCHLGLAVVYSILGQESGARTEVAELLKINPNYSLECMKPIIQSFKDESVRERLIEGLKKAGLPYKEASPTPEKPSIAVLAFDNMSGDPNQEYFSDGITEQIISSLAKVPRLLVIARNSTFTYKGKPVKVQQVAKELGVRYVLEGSVQKSGDRVRIIAQLIDAKTGEHIWSEQYDRDIKDIFALQDQITKEILTAVRIKLTAGESARINARGTENLQAFYEYIKAIKHVYGVTKSDGLQARRDLEKVITLDPNWSMPYAFLSWVCIMDVWLHRSKSPLKSIQEGETLAKKAIELDDQNAIAHAMLCHIYLLKRQHNESIAEGRRAVELAPNLPLANSYLGMALKFSGRPQEAIEFLKTAVRVNPLPDPVAYFELASSYSLLGQYDKAIAACKKAIKISPRLIIPHIILTSIYSLAGREKEAHAQAKEVLRINPKFSIAQFSKIVPFKNKEDKDCVMDALRKAGLPDRPLEKDSRKPSEAATGNGLKGNIYSNKTPDFTITYPETWSAGGPDPGCLFTAKGGMFGIPIMNVRKEKAFASPEDAAKDTIRILEEGKGAKNCRVVYAKKTTLADGTPAFEIMISWDHPMAPGLYTAKTIAQNGNVIIGASITDNKEISAATVQFLRSLEIG